MGSGSGGEQKVLIQLAPRDAANVYGESDRGPANIVDAYVFDGGSHRMTEEEVLAWAGERRRCSPLLTTRLQRVRGDLDYPAWVTDDDFDVRNHVTVVSGDSDWGSVRWIVAGLVNSRMDLTQPPWDMTVIQGVTGIGQGMPEDATVVILRFHHSVGDAVATSAIARRMFVADPVGTDQVDDPASSETTAAGGEPRGFGSALLHLPIGLARFGRALFVGAATTRRVNRAVERGEIVVPEGGWPSTRFNRRLGGVPGVVVLYFDLATLRAIGSTVAGATVNDVMLTIIGGALATYLAESGESPAGTLAAKMPIAMRDGAGSANKFALGSVSLHTDIADPHRRLRLVHSSSRQEKSRQAHADVATQRGLSQWIPAFVTRVLGSRAARASGGPVSWGNTLVSNVPSQADGAVFGRAPIVAVFGVLTLADGDGIAHFVSSVGGRVSLTVTVDSAAMPDIGHYEKLLRSEFEALAAARYSRQVSSRGFGAAWAGPGLGGGTEDFGYDPDLDPEQ